MAEKFHCLTKVQNIELTRYRRPSRNSEFTTRKRHQRSSFICKWTLVACIITATRPVRVQHGKQKESFDECLTSFHSTVPGQNHTCSLVLHVQDQLCCCYVSGARILIRFLTRPLETQVVITSCRSLGRLILGPLSIPQPFYLRGSVLSTSSDSHN